MPARIFSGTALAIMIACGSVAAAEDFSQTGVALEKAKNESTFGFVSDLLFHFFSTFVSPVDERECIFNPTCSRYAREAIAKYGFIEADPLITARLLRCNNTAYSKGYYSAAKRSDDIWKAYDPVP